MSKKRERANNENNSKNGNEIEKKIMKNEDSHSLTQHKFNIITQKRTIDEHQLNSSN